MACISPDGKPTESGTRMLLALKSGSLTAEDIAKETALPLFRVRSGLRELARAELVKQVEDKYEITARGAELLS